MKKLHLAVSQTTPLIFIVASNLLQVRFSSLRYLFARAALRQGCLMSVQRGLDKRHIVMRLSRLSSRRLGSALLLLCSLNTFAQAHQPHSPARQIPSPSLCVLEPGFTALAPRRQRPVSALNSQHMPARCKRALCAQRVWKEENAFRLAFLQVSRQWFLIRGRAEKGAGVSSGRS